MTQTRISAEGRTARRLARMLTENTGRHFLDSGGAYGRNWERNAGHTVDTFMSAPEVSVEAFSDGDGYVTLDVFHYLRHRLEYLPRPSHRLSALGYTDSHRNDPWLPIMEAYAKRLHVGDWLGGDDCYWRYSSFNSFNEDNALSQTIQGVTFTHPTYGACVVLQIHGGADVRGGYTAPAVFRVTSDEPHDLFDWYSYSVVCRTHYGQERDNEGTLPLDLGSRAAWHPTHTWDLRNGDWVTSDGSFEADPWADSPYDQFVSLPDGPAVLCPECGSVCDVYAPTTW